MLDFGYIQPLPYMPFQEALERALKWDEIYRRPLLEGGAEWYQGDPIFCGGKNLPPLLTADYLEERVSEWLFRAAGRSYGQNRRVGCNMALITRAVSYAAHCKNVYESFGVAPEGLLTAQAIAVYVCYTISQHNAAAAARGRS